jgi:DNA-binding NarL/FixJ family response regulator
MTVKPHNAGAGAEGEGLLAPPRKDEAGDAAGGQTVRVLIADDHAVVRQGLKQILSSEPDMVVVGEARNIVETLELAGSTEWDVLVLDYSMPGGNGLLALKEIRQNHPRRQVLMLSMHPEDTIAISALRAGAAGYMNKECASDELTLAIRKAASGKKYVSPVLAEKLALEIEEGAEGLPHESLSEREYRVMWMIAAGRSITQIAEELFLSPNTVSTYRVRILRKLKVLTNADIVRYAVKHGLME